MNNKHTNLLLRASHALELFGSRLPADLSVDADEFASAGVEGHCIEWSGM